MIGNKVEYIQAYTEIKCLLRYFPIEYLKKLPIKLLEMIYKNSDEKYNIDVDLNKDLKEQNISKKARDILVVLNYNYWSDESEKKYLKNRFYENERVFQKELSEKYNPDNLFKRNSINTDYENIKEKAQENVALIEVKDSIFKKIWNKIKSLLKK